MRPSPVSRSSGYSPEHKASFTGPLWHLDKGKTWREVQASFVPATNKLVLDGTGLTLLLKEIETCRHDAMSPKGFEDYGMVIVLRDGRTIHLATYSGMEKYDWIERLTASAPPSLSTSANATLSPKTATLLSTPSRDSTRSSSVSLTSTPLSAQSSAASSAQMRKLTEENQQLRQQLDEQQARVEALKVRRVMMLLLLLLCAHVADQQSFSCVCPLASCD